MGFGHCGRKDCRLAAARCKDCARCGFVLGGRYNSRCSWLLACASSVAKEFVQFESCKAVHCGASESSKPQESQALPQHLSACIGLEGGVDCVVAVGRVSGRRGLVLLCTSARVERRMSIACAVK